MISPKVFGCVSFVHVHSHGQGKLDPRAVKCVFIGYSPTQKGYKCYHPPTRKTYVSTNVTFVERENYFSSPSLQGETLTMEDQDLFLSVPLVNKFPESVESTKFPESTEPTPTPILGE